MKLFAIIIAAVSFAFIGYVIDTVCRENIEDYELRRQEAIYRNNYMEKPRKAVPAVVVKDDRLDFIWIAVFPVALVIGICIYSFKRSPINHNKSISHEEDQAISQPLVFNGSILLQQQYGGSGVGNGAGAVHTQLRLDL